MRRRGGSEVSAAENMMHELTEEKRNIERLDDVPFFERASTKRKLKHVISILCMDCGIGLLIRYTISMMNT